MIRQPIRPSICLFCTLAREQASRLPRPLVQVARRSGKASNGHRKDGEGRNSFTLDGAKGYRTSHERFPPSFLRAFTPKLAQQVTQSLPILKQSLQKSGVLEGLNLQGEALEKEWERFELSIVNRVKKDGHIYRPHLNEKDLYNQMKHYFFDGIFFRKFTRSELVHQREVADLRFPGEWYPEARGLVRTVHLHVGPTNSGKTYRALKRLEEAKTGCYLGPLRLLAHEVYTRLNAKGISCALITGEEMRIPDEVSTAYMASCTVEMAPLNSRMEVAVLDEIQMISDPNRGWAWTQALLGLSAQEIHVCGEERAVPLVRELCASVGDKVEVHRYERLSPLRVADRSLNGSLKGLEKGDCVVSFSILAIHAMRKRIQKLTGKNVAIIYGSLPPETRAQQAELFNNPENDYDYLVASDAVGMGLNLNIKRVIFESVTKYDGHQLVPLSVSQIKQIGGRAGRYKTSHQAITESISNRTSIGDAVIEDGVQKGNNTIDPVAPVTAMETESNERATSQTELSSPTNIRPSAEPTTVGYVTSLEQLDFPMLKQKMSLEPEPIATAGLFPPTLVVERFASYFPPGTPFSYIMLRLHEIAGTSSRFHLCDLRDQTDLADVIQPLTNLTTMQRMTLVQAPTNLRNDGERIFLYTLAECVAEGKSGALLDLRNLDLEILDKPDKEPHEYLRDLEMLHKKLVIYLWLSYRFPHVFTTRNTAQRGKTLVEEKIEACLQQISIRQMSAIAARRKKKMEKVLAAEMAHLKELASSLEAERNQTVGDSREEKPGDYPEVVPSDDVDEYPTDIIDFPSRTMADIHRHHKHSRLAHTKLRFGEYASIEEIASIANGYDRRVELLRRNVEDVKRGYESGINLNVDPLQPAQLHL